MNRDTVVHHTSERFHRTLHEF